MTDQTNRTQVALCMLGRMATYREVRAKTGLTIKAIARLHRESQK